MVLCSSALINQYLLADAAKNGLKAVKSTQYGDFFTLVWCDNVSNELTQA